MDRHSLTRRAAAALAAAMLGAPLLAVRAGAAQEGEGAAAPVAGWVAVRTYALKPGTDREEMIRDTEESLVPVMRGLDGWVAFYVLRPAEETWTGVTVWRDKAASDAGGLSIREWIAANVAGNIASGPEAIEGSVDLMAFADAPGMATPAPAD